jgi:hypothetical protein
MSEGELVSLLKVAAEKGGAWLPFLVIAWAELRLFPRLDAHTALDQAIASKLGVTPADVAAHTPPPRSLLDRFRGRGASVLLLLLFALGIVGCAGCSMLDANDGVRENVPKLRTAWRTFRDASEPAPVVSRDAWVNLGDAIEANMTELQHAADE